MRTMHELRVDIRDKIPELEVREEMEATEVGLEPIRLSGADMQDYYDTVLPQYCQSVLLACDGLREWLYDEDGSILGTHESELLDWLNADDGDRGIEGFYRDLDEARKDFPSEVQDCNRLLEAGYYCPTPENVKSAWMGCPDATECCGYVPPVCPAEVYP